MDHIEQLREKLQYFKQVRDTYRGDDNETDYAKGQHKALVLVISHLEPIITDYDIDDLFGDGTQFNK